MANETRLRSNNLLGTITDNPLLIGATTINSPGFVDLPVVDTTNHLVLILDPTEANGAAEIVQVTAHAAASSQVTVVRGYDSSTPRQHPLGTTWHHGPVASDFRYALGQIGYAQAVASQAGITTIVDLTNLSASAAIQANRRIRISGQAFQFTRTAGTVTFVELSIWEGATRLTRHTSALPNTYAGCNVSIVTTPTVGSHTYKLRAQCDGTVTLEGAADAVNYILIEDIGPA